MALLLFSGNTSYSIKSDSMEAGVESFKENSSEMETYNSKELIFM